MNDRHGAVADCVTRARSLVARARRGVEQLESVAGQAFYRLTALAGLLTRLESLARSHEPEAIEAAVLDAATVCREAEVLLRYLDGLPWSSVRAYAVGRNRARSRLWLDGALASDR
jgi:hypothetical protein